MDLVLRGIVEREQMVWFTLNPSHSNNGTGYGAIYHVSEVLYTFPHLILQSTLPIRQHHLCFADKQTEAQQGEVI